MPKTLKEQSEAVLKKHLSLGETKRAVETIGNTKHHRFTSVRSYKETASTLARIAKVMGVSRLKEITPQNAIQYLNERKQQESKTRNFVHVQKNTVSLVSQKTLDAERKALSILLAEPLSRVYSSADRPSSSRAYTNTQVQEISKHQSERNALSTRIASEAGLRASELFTLRRADELQISTSRKWSPERFIGLEGNRYVVIGKGGLVREIVLSHETSAMLECHRLSSPQVRTDRGVKYESYYDIGAGNNFSKSYSDASSRALGFSNGAHGLRHQYAQARLSQIQSFGKTQEEAKLILSQEIGHFRASITNTYLR